MGSPGTWRRASSAARSALVGARRLADVHNGHVGPLADQRLQQGRPVADGFGYVEAVLLDRLARPSRSGRGLRL